jgi:diaminopimelate decarboxylase
MQKLNNFSGIDAATIARVADEYGTPIYVYDENLVRKRCKECLAMPHAYGFTVRYAMKANSNRTLLKIISGEGLQIDASSLMEAQRAVCAGIPHGDIMLTTQEIPSHADREELERMMLQGMKYNVCSLRQLELIAGFAAENGIDLGMRVHPGVGAGESSTRNTGDDYACFGVHLDDIEKALRYAGERGVKFKLVHEHIGSGGDPEAWRENIDLELSIVERYFPDAEAVSFGGGLKEARMPDEHAADVETLGLHAKEMIEAFYQRTGRKLKMEIEPGTYIVANSGYDVTRVIDKKRTSRSNFVILDGGMEVNARPLLYGSRHPISIVAADGSEVKWTDVADADNKDPPSYSAVVAGICCESGDCQTIDAEGRTVPRTMAEPEIGDIAVIGGTGAYCSSMAPFNYNSHAQAPEVLYTTSGELKQIRNRQTLTHMLANEV